MASGCNDAVDYEHQAALRRWRRVDAGGAALWATGASSGTGRISATETAPPVTSQLPPASTGRTQPLATS